MHLFRTLVLKISSNPWIEYFVKKSLLFQPQVKRFIAGETINEAIIAAEKLIEEGVTVTLDNLGENVTLIEEIEASKILYLKHFKAISKSKQKERIDMSIKITQCGLDHPKELTVKNYTEILEFATKENIFVRVDMEGFAYTQATLWLIEKMKESYKLFLYFYSSSLLKRTALGAIALGLFQFNLAAPKITHLPSDPYGEATTPLLLSKDGTIVIGTIGKKGTKWPVFFWKNGLLTELKANESIAFSDLQYHGSQDIIVGLGNSKVFDGNCDQNLSSYAWSIDAALKGKKKPFSEKSIYKHSTKMNYWVAPKEKLSCFLFDDDSWNKKGEDCLLIDPKIKPFEECIGPADAIIKYAISKEGILSALVETKAGRSPYCKNTIETITEEKEVSNETNNQKNNNFSGYFYRFLMYDFQSKTIQQSLPFEKSKKIIPHDILLTPTPSGLFLSIIGKEYEHQDSIFFWDQEQEHSPISLNLPITLPLGLLMNFAQPAFFGKTFVLCLTGENAITKKNQQFVCYWHVESNRCDQLFTFNLEEKALQLKAKTFGDQNQILYLELSHIQYAQLIFLQEPSSTALPKFTNLKEWIHEATEQDGRFDPEEKNCYLIDVAQVDGSLESGTWLISTHYQNKKDKRSNYYLIQFKEDQKQ